MLLVVSPAVAEPEPAGLMDGASVQANPAVIQDVDATVNAAVDATVDATGEEPLGEGAVLVEDGTSPDAPSAAKPGVGQTRATLNLLSSPEIPEAVCDRTAQDLPSQVVLTSQTVCQSGLTPPSLWWTKDQVAEELKTGGKLVNTWSARPKTADRPGQVSLVVNPQMWSLMDYFDRYDFVNNFGLAARGFGYQTEIYNPKGNSLASYSCATTEGTATLGPRCIMDLRSSLNLGSRSR